MFKHLLFKRFLGVLLACIVVLPTIPTRVSADDTKVLYLADWYGLIWSMNLENRTILGSFRVVEGAPTGLALLDGILYVSTVFPNKLFAFDPNSGTQLEASDNEPTLDGLATIREARLVAGIEASFEQPETIHFYKPSSTGYGLVKAYESISVDVPGYAVRALAYAQGKLYISEESTQAIYVYDLDVTGPIPVITYNHELPVGFPAPGLAYDGNSLVAYDGFSAQIVMVSPGTGQSVDSFFLTGTGISDIVAGLEVGGVGYPEPITVNIDVKPGSYPNSINPGSSGVIPVAILSSEAFDATTVNPETIRLAGAAVRRVSKAQKPLCHFADVNSDGLPDLVCLVETKQLRLEPGASHVTLAATTYDGQAIRGTDSISIVPKGAGG